MYVFLITLHVTVSLIMVGVILLQAGYLHAHIAQPLRSIEGAVYIHQRTGSEERNAARGGGAVRIGPDG